MRNNRSVFIMLLLWIIFFGKDNCSAQKLIADTSFVHVPVDSNLSKINGRLSSYADSRPNDQEVLRIKEKTVYYYIPVDHYIMIDTTMNSYIASFFNSSDGISYEITVNRFDIGTRNGLFFPAITLQGEFNLKKITGTDTLSGKLLYDEWVPVRGKKEDGLSKEEYILKKWERAFLSDLGTIQKFNVESTDRLPYNFVANERKPKTNLDISTRFIGGLDYYIIEGELMFFEPEANRRSFRTGHIFRYRNAENFESVGFGRKAEHVFFRRNDYLVFDLNVNFLLGINRWKDINEVDRPVWHVVLLDLSFSQFLKYQPFNSMPTFVVGAGLFENFYFIPDENFYFKPGIGIQMGYRF